MDSLNQVSSHVDQGYRLSSIATDPTSNYKSTADTIAQMRQLVIESVGTVQLQQACQELLSRCKDPNQLVSDQGKTVCREVFYYVKGKLRLMEDEHTLISQYGYNEYDISNVNGMELLQSPAFVLSLPHGTAQGDCDEFSMLTCALLLCLGVRNVFFCTVAADGNIPDNFTHVYSKVMLMDGSMYSLDTSHGAMPGWETDSIYREQLWQVG